MKKLAAFLIHECAPYQKEIVRKLYKLPEGIKEFPLSLPPIIGGRYFIGGEPICILTIVPLTVRQFLGKVKRDIVIAKIKEAIKFSRQQGAEIVGLGALTSSVTNGGNLLTDQEVAITNGNPFTVYTAYQGIKKLTLKLGMSLRNCRIAIIGATGSVGFGLVEMLLEEMDSRSILGIGRDLPKIEELKNFGIEAGDMEKLPQIEKYDLIVICISGFPEIKPSNFRGVKSIYDLTMPKFTAEMAKELTQAGIILENGGLVLLPRGYSYEGVDIGLPRERIVYACLADTLLRALEGENNHTVGRVSLLEVKRIGVLGVKHQFSIVS